MTFVNTVDVIGDEALTSRIIDRSITEINDNYTKSIGIYAFSACSALTAVDFRAVTSVGEFAFDSCSALTTADFRAVTSIVGYAFQSCSKLAALILRSETMASLVNASALNSTPIASGTGYIYVPAALVDAYKSAANWGNYANKFRALEDYTVDGTITGELDPAKTGS